jgi:DNA-binding MarR family transcriptional regulator
MSLIEEWYEKFGSNDHAIFHAFADLLSETRRGVEESKGVNTAISYCMFYLAHQPKENGKSLAEQLTAGEVTNDQMVDILMEDLNQAMLDVTLTALSSEGLVDVMVDENGEFTFTLTEQGKEAAENLAENFEEEE